MSFYRVAVALTFVAGLALADPLSTLPIITPTGPVDPTSTACGDIVVAKEQGTLTIL
jgi:hypothetical protein